MAFGNPMVKFEMGRCRFFRQKRFSEIGIKTSYFLTLLGVADVEKYHFYLKKFLQNFQK